MFIRHFLVHRIIPQTNRLRREKFRLAVIVLTLLFMACAIDPILAGDIWIKSFTAQPAGTAPNSYRYDRAANPQDIEIFFNYNFSGTVDMQVSVNGGLFNAGFSCSWDDANPSVDASCFVTLPYDCGKVTFRVRQLRASSLGKLETPNGIGVARLCQYKCFDGNFRYRVVPSYVSCPPVIRQ